jgi:hypothetical protein
MAIINKGKSFANGEQLTADKLNQVIDNATFTTSAVDNVSTQLAGEAIIVKDGGVTTAKLNDSGVTTAKIADANVTTAKIANANVTFAKLTDVIDDDTMAAATDTTLATSESIKAYVDSISLKAPTAGATGTISATTSYQDLDLSAAVGSNTALVIMEVYGGSNAADLHFKTKGSSIDSPYLAASLSGWGASGAVTSTSSTGSTVIVVTDSSGVVQFKSSAASTSINYNIQAYQKVV